MADRPDPPPWGAAISAALTRAGLSAREAARRAGISEGRWRQITGGYQVVSPGVYAQVRGPATTLAKMAAVAGVTPAELRAAGRDDAARELTRHQARSPGEEMLERVRALDSDQARELLATIALQLGVSLPDSDTDTDTDADTDTDDTDDTDDADDERTYGT
jgi:transcriptional regulator with XRE-family HTH domain